MITKRCITAKKCKETKYRKIPIISPGLIFFQKVFCWAKNLGTKRQEHHFQNKIYLNSVQLFSSSSYTVINISLTLIYISLFVKQNYHRPAFTLRRFFRCESRGGVLKDIVAGFAEKRDAVMESVRHVNNCVLLEIIGYVYVYGYFCM